MLDLLDEVYYFGLAIGVVLAVVFPFVAIAIKLDSPGAIFYQQERVGQYGAKFTVYKLLTTKDLSIDRCI
ncbi:MAG: sugar transferase [Chamaesiphon sp.]|nr:sugar transferase [Chamaesiphon sp.]